MPGSGDVRLGNPTCLLAEAVQKHQKPVRTPVENTVERSPEMTSQLPELSFDLGAMRERQVRHAIAERVEASNLILQRGLFRTAQPSDELPHRL